MVAGLIIVWKVKSLYGPTHAKEVNVLYSKMLTLELLKSQMFHFVAHLFLLLLPANGDYYLTN